MGITPERLEHVRRTLEAEEEQAGDRIGLRNVHDRLKLSYGEEYGLTITSRPGEGTVILFCIPLEEMNL